MANQLLHALHPKGTHLCGAEYTDPGGEFNVGALTCKLANNHAGPCIDTHPEDPETLIGYEYLPREAYLGEDGVDDDCMRWRPLNHIQIQRLKENKHLKELLCERVIEGRELDDFKKVFHTDFMYEPEEVDILTLTPCLLPESHGGPCVFGMEVPETELTEAYYQRIAFWWDTDCGHSFDADCNCAHYLEIDEALSEHIAVHGDLSETDEHFPGFSG